MKMLSRCVIGITLLAFSVVSGCMRNTVRYWGYGNLASDSASDVLYEQSAASLIAQKELDSRRVDRAEEDAALERLMMIDERKRRQDLLWKAATSRAQFKRCWLCFH